MNVPRNAISVYASLAIRVSGGLTSTAILARRLDLDDFGFMAFAIGLSTLVWTLCDFGISMRGQVLFTSRGTDPARLACLQHQSMRFRTYIGLAILPIVLVLPALHHIPTTSDLPTLVLAWLAGWSNAITPAWIISLQRRSWTILPVDIGASLGGIAAATWAVHGRSDIGLVFLPQCVGNIALVTWFAARYRRPAGTPPLRILAWVRFFLPALALRTSISAISICLVFIFALSSAPAQLAIFAAADRVLRYAITGLSPIFSLTAPFLFSPLHHEVRSTTWFRPAYITIHALIGMTAAVAVWLAAPLAIRLIYGSRFDDSIPLTAVLALAIPFWMIENVIITQVLVLDRRELVGMALAIGAAAILLVAAMAGLATSAASMAWWTVAGEAILACGGLAAVLWRARR